MQVEVSRRRCQVRLVQVSRERKVADEEEEQDEEQLIIQRVRRETSW